MKVQRHQFNLISELLSEKGTITLDSVIKTFDLFAVKIFTDIDYFYDLQRKYSHLAFQRLFDTGISAESNLGKLQFQTLINQFNAQENHSNSHNSYEIHQLLYYYDCDNLVKSLQNIIIESDYLSTKIFKELQDFDKYNTLHPHSFTEHPHGFTGVIFTSGVHTIELYSLINHLFISFNSLLDYITKIAFELENIADDFSNYPKLKSNKKIFGDKKELHIKNLVGTIFEEDCCSIRFIQSFRNEIIHNGSIDDRHKIYQNFENDILKDQFILLPDMNNGKLEKYKNRTRFYGNENRWDKVMPPIELDIWNRIRTSLESLYNEHAA